MTDLRPGIYPGTSYDVYASWPAVRASTLNACARSMAHGREAEINPADDTDALAFGTALHTALLEPERFRKEYIVTPKFDRRTKAGKSAWTQFEDEYGHLMPIVEDEYDAAEAMIRSVYGCRDAAELLANATARELSFVWSDGETGLLCKGRVDLLTTFEGWTFIVDLKSTRDASQFAFQSQMTKLRYYASLAWYRLGLNVLAPHDRRCALLPVEKTPPYACKPYEVMVDAIENGEIEMRALLRKYAVAREIGLYEAYGHDMGMIDLPHWKHKELEAA